MVCVGTKTWLPADRLCIALLSCQSLNVYSIRAALDHLSDDSSTQNITERAECWVLALPIATCVVEQSNIDR